MKRVCLLLVLFVNSVSAAPLIAIGFKAGHIDNLTLLVYGLAGGVATVMAVLNGYKFMVADDDQDRLEAKKNLINILVALLILMIATALVNTFLSMPTGYS